MQNHQLRKVLVLLPIVILSSCKQQVTIRGLDKELWANDKFACSGIRRNYIQLIDDNKTNLLQLDQNEIEGVLGLPDVHELDKRKRKYFYYFLEPGSNCDAGKEYPVKLQIRFNALGLSSEVFLENY